MLDENTVGKISRAGSILDFSEEGLTIRGIEFVVHVADQNAASKAIRDFFLSLGAPESMEIKPIEQDKLPG